MSDGGAISHTGSGPDAGSARWLGGSPKSRLALSVLAGVLLAACFPNYNLAWLVWIAPAPLLLALLHESSLKRAYLLGAISGAIFLLLSVYWIALVMKNYGNMSWPAAIGVMAAFLTADSSYWGLFALATCGISRRSRGLALLAAGLIWVVMELFETYGYFGGFPWNLLGYGIEATGLRQIATLTGVYGLSFLAFTTSALAIWLILDLRSIRRRAALALWIAALAVANYALRPPPPTEGSRRAVLVQPNVPLNEGADLWAPWRNPVPLLNLSRLSLDRLRAFKAPATMSSGPPLIVWSENSAPFYFNRDAVFRSAVETLARQAGAYVIAGATNFAGPGETQPLNSAIVIDPSGDALLQYAKIHLVPFGEYVPAWLDHVVGKITSEAGNFVPGTSYASAPAGGGRIGVFICYEEVFPQLVRRLTPRGPGVLVNISDDAWYGDSSAAFQTMEMARLRAIENRRYLLRSTNDGITDIIDPYGRVRETLPRHQQAALAGYFDFESKETFYSTHGDVFAWSCVALGGLLVVGATLSGKL
ncbi:MAG TPA: apolipoprotein N-acyltransferase [Terriglobia bacterium]|nr:apolipoprotein N-acyltransferase [Terriglobia bacterium]